MTFALLVLAIALGWLLATGTASLPNLLLGAVVGALVLWLVRERIQQPGMLRRSWWGLDLFGTFLVQLLLSAIGVARLVLRPEVATRIRPAIVAFPLRVRSDAGITLLANLITLTPGTLSIDVAEDRSVLYIHAIDMPSREALLRDIAESFEAKVMRLLS